MIMVVIVITVMVPIPVAVVVPLMVVNIPPGVVFAPATLALGVQITPPVIRLPAVHAMPVNRLVESDLRPFNALLALCPIIRVRTRHPGKQQQHTQHCGSDRRFSESCVISLWVHCDSSLSRFATHIGSVIVVPGFAPHFWAGTAGAILTLSLIPGRG
jgi:hypothetical protein